MQTTDPPSPTLSPSSNPFQSLDSSARQHSTTSSSSGFSSSHSSNSINTNAADGGDTATTTDAARHNATRSLSSALPENVEASASSCVNNVNKNTRSYVTGGSVGGLVNRVEFTENKFASANGTDNHVDEVSSSASSRRRTIPGALPHQPSILSTCSNSSSSEPSSLSCASKQSSSPSPSLHHIRRDVLGSSCSAGNEGAVLELSFEYLLRAGELRWVRVLSSQAVLMSLCLQVSVVPHYKATFYYLHL